MRQYLNEQFPETKEIDNKELEQIILDLTERAAAYKLILETHVAPFIVAAWIMGLEFDQNFIAAKEVLENMDMDSEEKANWLWQFLEDTIGILEDNDSTEEKSFFDRFFEQ
jgi:hypothetical protein